MSGVGQYNLTSSDGTTPQAALGQEINVKGATYQYFKAAGAINAYDSCTVDNTWQAVQGTTTTSGAKPTLFCIPQFAVASGEYFWAPVGPFYLREDNSTTFKVNAIAGTVNSVKTYTSATAGYVDDAATDLIAGLTLTSTTGGSNAATPCIATQRLVSNCQD